MAILNSRSGGWKTIRWCRMDLDPLSVYQKVNFANARIYRKPLRNLWEPGTFQKPLGSLENVLSSSHSQNDEGKTFKNLFFRPVYNSSRCCRSIYTILFDTRCYNGFFARPARKIHYSAPGDIIHVDYNTAAALHYTYKHWYNSAHPKPLRK